MLVPISPSLSQRRTLTAGLALALALHACTNEPFASAPRGPLEDSGAAAGGRVGTGGDPTSSGGGAAAGGMAPIQSSGGAGFQDPGDAAQACIQESFAAQLQPAKILFVVDRSASMNCNLDVPAAECEENPVTTDPTAATKWQVIVNALKNAFRGLALGTGISVGLTFFSSDDACGVGSVPEVILGPLTPLHLDALDRSLDAVTPKGGTPIVGATILAYKHLHQSVRAHGNRFVVIVTDGEDSCLDKYEVPGDAWSRLLQTEIPKARSVNIRTFVIGIPGSEIARDLLSQLAFAGGTARSETCRHPDSTASEGDCHFDITTSDDLSMDLAAALRDVAGQSALSCDFPLPTTGQSGDPIDFDRVNVTYYRGGRDAIRLAQDTDWPCETGADGWQYTQDRSQIRVCGPACLDIRYDPNARVDIELGCSTRVR